jgi:hypothetical protein
LIVEHGFVVRRNAESSKSEFNEVGKSVGIPVSR